MHLDLIVGLPFEDFNSFGKSFDDVFNLRPDVLQLGFLKLLRGTKIRSEEEKYGYRYNSKPPYEVLKNDFISYEDVLLLKGIEEVLNGTTTAVFLRVQWNICLKNIIHRLKCLKICGCFTTETDTIKSDNREILCMKYCRIFVMMNCFAIF